MATPIRILFLAWGHSIHGERRIRVFADDPGFTVALASPYDYQIANARYYRLPDLAAGPAIAREIVGLAAARMQLGRFAAEFRPDVVFLQTLLYPGFLGLTLRASLPKVITFWNGDLLTWTYATGAERLLKRRILRHGLKRAAAVTVNSEAARRVCLDQGTPAQNVHVIRYPGIDLKRFFPMNKEQAKRALGLAGHPVILNERGPVPHKNADMLVRAAPLVLARYPNARFLFLSPEKGAGAESFAPYIRLARELGVDYAMHWRGNVAYDVLPQAVNAADLWVSLSTEDSMPNSMLDAMACGIPVISADLVQIREWVTDGVTGRLVDPLRPDRIAERIVEALDRPADSLRMAQAARDTLAGRADFASQVAAIKRLVARVAFA